MAIIATDPALNGSKGLAGGLPGHPGNGLAAWSTPIRRLLADGKLPRDYNELTGMLGELERQSPKAVFGLSQDDVLVFEYVAGGGYGDPIKREPQDVRRDVAEGSVTAAFALSVYGVVLGERGDIDADATAEVRQRMRQRRIAEAKPPIKAGPGTGAALTGLTVVFDGLSVGVDEAGGRWWACSGCAHALAPQSENYKLGAGTLEHNPAELSGLGYPDPTDFCDEEAVIRQHTCPSCGELFNSELCRPSDPPLWDIALAPAEQVT